MFTRSPQASWFSWELRQLSTRPAARSRSRSSFLGTVITVPPTGGTGSRPASGTGIAATAQSTSSWASSTGTCQGPLIIMAALPDRNWSLTSCWFQLTTEREAEPESTSSFQSVSAATPPVPSVRFASSPPADQKNGRNW